MTLLDGNHLLGIDVMHHGDGTTACLRGDLDVATAPRLGHVMSGILDAGHVDVVLDLDQLEFCDSTGLGAMLSLHRRFEDAGGRLELQHPAPMLRRILEITALDRTLHVVG